MKKFVLFNVVVGLLFASLAYAEPEVYTIGGERMAPNGTSTWVIDLGKLKAIDGYFTFGLDTITGITTTAIAGSTVGAFWRVSQHNTANHWAKNTRNTLFSGIDVRTGATNVGYDLTSGVTPLRYMRIELDSGVTNITPTGTLLIR